MLRGNLTIQWLCDRAAIAFNNQTAIGRVSNVSSCIKRMDYFASSSGVWECEAGCRSINPVSFVNELRVQSEHKESPETPSLEDL